MAKHIPTPYTATDRNWRGEKAADGSYYVTGGGYYSHDEECVCECDGHLEECDCTDGCGWVGTAVCVVPGNPTAGDIPRATAEFIVRAANCHDELLAALQPVSAEIRESAGDPNDHTWSPDAHVEITLTITECRALLAAVAKAGE